MKAVRPMFVGGLLFLLLSAAPTAAQEGEGGSIRFAEEDSSPPSAPKSFIEGPTLALPENPSPPDELEPLEPPLPSNPAPPVAPAPTAAPAVPTPTWTAIPKPAAPTATPRLPGSTLPITSPPRPSAPAPEPLISRPPSPAPAVSSPLVTIEMQSETGAYESMPGKDTSLRAGQRVRFQYPGDQDWRLLESYGNTEVHFLQHHYEVVGNFFHTWRDGENRVQVPTLKEARDRRDDPDSVDTGRLNFRLFVEVNQQAPKAPAPEGNCLVWQRKKLWMNDLVGGSVDSALQSGAQDRMEVTAFAPGLIYVISPPSQIAIYAVKVNFEAEIFKVLGREKGRADAEIARLTNLYNLAKTPEEQGWVESRLAYEQEVSGREAQRQAAYESFLGSQIDAFGLIRMGLPVPHVQLAEFKYEHENLQLKAGFFSDNLGKCVVTANALLWINEAVPLPSTPFAFEIVDSSDPAFVGFDTRFRGEGDQLVAEERFKGSSAWVARNVVTDLYYYAAFRPPQPSAPPGYLVDLTVDITGGLKRLNKDRVVTARLGAIQLTPDQFRVDFMPQGLVASGPTEEIDEQIIIQPFRLRDWYAGRRVRIHDVFESVTIIPDELLDEVEKAVDEVGMKVYQLEKPRRVANPAYVYKPIGVSISLARTTKPGELSLEVNVKNEENETVSVTRAIHPDIDVLDFAARSVALNRTNVRFPQFRPLSLSEWVRTRTISMMPN